LANLLLPAVIFFLLRQQRNVGPYARRRGTRVRRKQRFPQSFKGYGWYLDDLVLEPVDKLSPLEREAKCLDAKNSLAGRIAEYQPLAIVTLLFRIRGIVDAAAITAKCNAPRFAVPFPGMGNQNALKRRWRASSPNFRD
jgi:hypothetical protein